MAQADHLTFQHVVFQHVVIDVKIPLISKLKARHDAPGFLYDVLRDYVLRDDVLRVLRSGVDVQQRAIC
jgi:hypothetical protein